MQRLAEEPVEERPGGAGLVRMAHLAEDLAFAGNERVESAGNSEEVERGRLVSESVQRGGDLRLELGEHVDGDPLGLVCVGRGDVELGAVAGREADRLARLACDGARERRGVGERERDALAQLHGGETVRRSDQDEPHTPPPMCGRPRRTTITRTKPTSAR